MKTLPIIQHSSQLPSGFQRQVSRSLRWIDPTHLTGLDSIRIELDMPEVPVGPEVEWAADVRARGQTNCVGGWYASATGAAPPYIMLYARAIYRPIPSFLFFTTCPTLRVLSTLAHEVAHHLVATRGYVFSEGEDLTDEEALAEAYSEHVLNKTRTKWSYRFGQRLLRELSDWKYGFAAADWERQRYQRAAEGFYNAWSLNPNHVEAAYWYHRAKQKCGSS